LKYYLNKKNKTLKQEEKNKDGRYNDRSKESAEPKPRILNISKVEQLISQYIQRNGLSTHGRRRSGVGRCSYYT